MKYTFLLVALAVASIAAAQSLEGLWDARIDFNGVQIPFQMGFAGKGADLKGWFVNGDDRESSTSGRFEHSSLVLNFDDYATKLTASLKDGALDGEWGPYQKKMHPFHAERHAAPQRFTGTVPSIDGQWEVQSVKSSKGESTWRLIVQQRGAEVAASILRIDGDTGAVTGQYRDGQFVLSHFSGARPSMLVLKPAAGGTLAVNLIGIRGANEYTALRPAEARAKGLPEPTDPATHTGVKVASQPFAFSFPDLNGKIVTNADARFRGKVLLVNITGSWCPNCHDEAPFLAELYRKYRDQGLEIVALSFEEGDQLKDPARLRAFVKKYGIEYTVLLCGEPAEAKDKLTQAANWDAWPTTFFIGRDGLVRSVHAGFPSRATGDLHLQMKEEFAAKIERLLAENKTSSRE